MQKKERDCDQKMSIAKIWYRKIYLK